MTNFEPRLRLGFLALSTNLILASLAVAQAGDGGTPPSLAHPLATQVPTEVMPPIDVAALLAEDAAQTDKVAPFRFGWGHEVQLGLEEAGLWEELPGGQRLWRLRLESPGAFSINLIFDRYELPDGARLWVHNDAGRVLGAFTSALNQPHGMFATEPLAGDAVTLEYVEPASAPIGALRVSQVVHAYREILGESAKRGGSTKAGACNINVNCPLGANWQDQKRSVARLIMGSVMCSGALINNSAEDSRQFFLTANHCYTGDPSTWVFQFNYESPTCSGSGATPQTVTGSVLKTRSQSPLSDHCLVEITQPIPGSFHAYYSGWSRSTSPATVATGMHHPGGGIKKICQDADTLTQSNFNLAPCWKISSWEQGVTEGGSSGSPLFDQNHRIVGQLFGGQASCALPLNDYYGRLDISWGQGLGAYLDPLSKGSMTQNGMEAIPPSTTIYCTAKTNSLGNKPSIGFGGTPSLAANDFVIECIGGIPKSNVILFYGAAPASLPFAGGRLCASAPYHREPMKVFDAMGMVQYSIPVSLQMVGAARFYQFWGRDTNHPDGTGTLLSNALEVHFKN
jgi:lysyl endopeptidase